MKGYRHRSAVSGRFVKKKFAIRHRSTTVREVVRSRLKRRRSR